MMKHILLIKKKNEAGQLKKKLKKKCEKDLAKNFSYDSQHVTLNNPIYPSSGKAINKLTSK